MSIFDEISQKLQRADGEAVAALVHSAAAEYPPADILSKGLLSGMNTVGEKFRKNEIFVPEVLLVSRAMKAGLDALRPYFPTGNIPSLGTVVLGTVKGDFHDIGKELVKIMLEGNGLRVIDLGMDVPAETFVRAAKENSAQVICCSCLLSSGGGEVRKITALCKKAGIRDNVKIMIGGAPITDSFCRETGADAYTSNAADCAEKALAFCAG